MSWTGPSAARPRAQLAILGHGAAGPRRVEMLLGWSGKAVHSGPADLVWAPSGTHPDLVGAPSGSPDLDSGRPDR